MIHASAVQCSSVALYTPLNGSRCNVGGLLLRVQSNIRVIGHSLTCVAPSCSPLNVSMGGAHTRRIILQRRGDSPDVYSGVTVCKTRTRSGLSVQNQ